uniref:SFRICE_021083 n=1 Tax=Spodoptera frugiperda TaxID=7108 RepID=A0A2H1VTP4_SPOFR
MTRVVFVFLFLVFVTVRSDIVDDDDEKIILNCPDGEEEDYCPSTCMNDKCPRKENYLHMCVSDGCGRPRCKCQFNTKRAPNGTCIDTKFCPPFKCHNPHEEFVACPPYCPKDDCDHASPEGLCLINGLILVAECQPACRCIKGYWRKDGECVPYSECLVPVTSLPPVFFGK